MMAIPLVITNWGSAAHSRPTINIFNRIKYVLLKFLLEIQDMLIAASHHNQNLLSYVFFKLLRVL